MTKLTYATDFKSEILSGNIPNGFFIGTIGSYINLLFIKSNNIIISADNPNIYWATRIAVANYRYIDELKIEVIK